MYKTSKILMLWLLLAVAGAAALAQDSGTSQDNPPAQDNAQQPATPVPAYGQDNTIPPVVENPPISGLDTPGLEPHAAPLSYVQPRVHVMETADSNVGNDLGGAGIRSVTRAFVGVDLQRLWQNYKLALNYTGGVGYYSSRRLGAEQVQQLDVDQRINWKRGQLGVRDSFGYMPEGNFGGAYGSMNGLGQLLGSGAFGGGSVLVGNNLFGSLGQVPRITNLALLDVVEDLTPKSSVTASAGYNFVHYTENVSSQIFGSGTTPPITSFIGNSEESAQVGYDRKIGPHDQAALVYAFQNFNFSVSHAAFHSQIVQLMWGHRISGRMNFIIGAGPQLTGLHVVNQQCSDPLVTVPQCVANGFSLFTTVSDATRLSGAGRASLHYKFTKTNVALTYQHYNTSGSGFFAGAKSDIATLSATRPLSRIWSVTMDAGYSKNKRLQLAAAGIGGKSFDDGFAAIALHRMLGRSLHLFASYEFNEIAFDNSFCVANGGTGICSRISQRHMGTIGLDFTPRPIRLD